VQCSSTLTLQRSEWIKIDQTPARRVDKLRLHSHGKGAAMQPQNLLKVFARRFNVDGSVDSICLFCFATIASRLQEHELAEPEGDHFCWQRQDSPALMKPFLSISNADRGTHRSLERLVNHAKSMG